MHETQACRMFRLTRHNLQTGTHKQPPPPASKFSPNSPWTVLVRNGHATVSKRKTSRRHARHRREERESENAEKKDAALRSFKTIRRGRLVWSLNGCCYLVSPLTWLRTNICIWKKTVTPIHLYNALLLQLHMSKPDVFPTCISSFTPLHRWE